MMSLILSDSCLRVFVGRDILVNFASRVTTSFAKYVQFGTHSRHLPSKPWSMPSSAHASISPIAFSMGQAPTSLTVSSRSLILMHAWSLQLANTIRSQLQSDETSTGWQFSIVSSSSSTPSRAVSNLTFVSKLVEKIVNVRLSELADQHTLLPHVQSAYTVRSIPQKCCGGSAQWHDCCTWSWRDWSSGSPWHVRCIRHGRPQRAPGYNGTSICRHKGCIGVDIGLYSRSITGGARRRNLLWYRPNLLWYRVAFHWDPSWDQEFSVTIPRV